MKISLERLDTDAMELQLPGDQRVAIHSAARLRGVLETEGGRVALPSAGAERVVLDALRLHFGELVLSVGARATLEEVTLSLESGGGKLDLDVKAASIVAQELAVVIGDVRVGGNATLYGVRLVVHGEEGSLSAERVVLAGFGLGIGELEIAAEELSGLAVAIAWGAAGFRLAARTLEGPSLSLEGPDVRVAAKGVATTDLSLKDASLSAARFAALGGHVELAFAVAASAPPASRPSAKKNRASAPLLDWKVLDGLSGEIDVDVAVDLTVPIIGSRKATHRLRVPIEGGTIDYRELEDDLAHLENALLDFSVRDGALVLERVNPLFPARGHGKPIVVWDLPPDDVPIAENRRVRLAVLPAARLVGSDDEEPAERESSGGGIALRKLDFLRINVRLALAPVHAATAGYLRPRSIGSLVLQGNVFHALGERARPGTILGELHAVSLAVAALPVGAQRFDVVRVEIASVSPIEVTFSDVKPTKVLLDFSGIALEGIAQSTALR